MRYHHHQKVLRTDSKDLFLVSGYLLNLEIMASEIDEYNDKSQLQLNVKCHGFSEIT